MSHARVLGRSRFGCSVNRAVIRLDVHRGVSDFTGSKHEAGLPNACTELANAMEGAKERIY